MSTKLLLSENLHLLRVCFVSSSVLCLWDHALTFDDELDLIWLKPWSLMKCLYFVSRILGDSTAILNIIGINDPLVLARSSHHRVQRILYPVLLITCNYCLLIILLRLDDLYFLNLIVVGNRYFQLNSVLKISVTWCTQGILALRISSLYHWSGTVTVPLIMCSTIAAIVASSVLTANQVHAEGTNEPYPGIYICSVTSIPEWSGYLAVPTMVFDLLLLVFAVYACCRDISHLRERWAWRVQSLLTVLIRDSFYYFAVTMTIKIVWVLLYRWDPSTARLPSGFASAFTTIVGARLILNLRRAYYGRLESPDTVLHAP